MGGRDRGGGKKPPPFLSPSSSFSKRSRSVGRVPSLPKPPPAPPFVRRRVKKKKKVPARLWMRLDRRGGCEMFMCDKAFVAERSGLRTRDLRVVGPLLSRFPRILAREKAMVLKLEFIRAIVTADEVLLLEPLAQEVLPFVDKLRRQFPLQSLEADVDAATARHADTLQDGNKHAETGSECEAPFEFQVLELALEAVCLSFDSTVADLNRHAAYVLEDLTKNVSTRNLERIRSLKRNLTCLLAGVHKVRAEVEHLLDDYESMAQLHLSRKLKNGHHHEASLASTAASNTTFPSETSMVRPDSDIKQSTPVATSTPLDSNAGNLEMLLEDYFIQLDEIRSRVVLARGYIVDTEDCLNIQLDNQRNELLRFRLTMIIASFGIALNTLMVASFGMNMPFGINRPHKGDGNTAVGSFWPLVGAMSSFCLLLTIVLFAHAWRNGLLGS